MKERPIIFSGPMIRAILEGRKTMTRRAIKFPLNEFWEIGNPRKLLGDWALSEIGELRDGTLHYHYQASVDSSFPSTVNCPYGIIGNRLWVRETWCRTGAGVTLYRADNKVDRLYWRTLKWKPSIYMPRMYSRITLEIVNVRVERLKEITEMDAIREGCQHHESAIMSMAVGYIESFKELWESIYGSGSWEKNPWVWVVGFRRRK